MLDHAAINRLNQHPTNLWAQKEILRRGGTADPNEGTMFVEQLLNQLADEEDLAFTSRLQEINRWTEMANLLERMKEGMAQKFLDELNLSEMKEEFVPQIDLDSLLTDMEATLENLSSSAD